MPGTDVGVGDSCCTAVGVAVGAMVGDGEGAAIVTVGSDVGVDVYGGEGIAVGAAVAGSLVGVAAGGRVGVGVAGVIVGVASGTRTGWHDGSGRWRRNRWSGSYHDRNLDVDDDRRGGGRECGLAVYGGG